MQSTSDVNVKNIQNFVSLQYVVIKIASDVLRLKFCEKWKSVYDFEWTNVAENGKLFIDGPGKQLFHSSKNIQKTHLRSGNTQVWDLPLIIDSIKCLGSNSRRSDDEHKKMSNLKEIRNQLSHQPSTEMTEENFQKYWEAASQILLSFGVTQQQLDEAKNLKFTETTTFPEQQPRDESNSLRADELKEAGNKFYDADKFDEAVAAYTEAIELPGVPPKTLAFLYSNRSLMHLELKNFSDAKDDAKGVIHLNPTWWRGYARLADSYEKMAKYEKAIKNYEIALQMNPTPDSHQTTLTDSLYYCRRMLGKINRMESMQPHNFVNSTKEMFDDARKQLELPDATPLENIIDSVGYASVLSQDDASDPAVACAQGHRFLRGIGCEQDAAQAASRFAKAASKGSADGMYNLGALLMEGKGIKRSAQQGIDMFKQAAAQPSIILTDGSNFKLKNEGVSEAKHALGLAYYEGSGVPKDTQAGLAWWSRAFEEDGNGASANNIGIMYEEGELVAADIDAAILYYKFAAFDGLVRGMQNLFRVHMNRRNYSDGLDWYRLAVEKGSVKDTRMEEYMSRIQLDTFDSLRFVKKLKVELKQSRFRNIVLQCEELRKNMADLCKGRSEMFEQIVQVVPNDADAFIIEHRMWWKQTRSMVRESSRPSAALQMLYTHPSKWNPKTNVDVIGLKQIHFKDMDATTERIYEGFAVQLWIIDDAVIGQQSVNLIGQDSLGSLQRIFIYGIPLNDETQDIVGYGCSITIVSPYHKLGATDGKPMIRVADPSTIIYHTALTNKKRCRYCGNPMGVIQCKKCERAFYCTKKCLKKDAFDREHRLVCVKKL